jgi:hypothetical protein
MTKKLCTNCLHLTGETCKRPAMYTGLPFNNLVHYQRVLLALPWSDVCGLRGRFWEPKPRENTND